MIIDAPRREQIPAMRTLWREAFGDTEEFLDDFAATALSADRSRVAVIDGQVAGALYWFDCTCRGRRVAYLYAVATGKAFRRRGVCHNLMENTLEHLKRRGYAGAMLVPESDDLVRFYETMGYRPCTTIRSFVCSAAGEPVQLYPVDKIQYARLRRVLLPEGGVIQEQENLDFLITHTRLYAGTGFLLAARKTGQKLEGLELLGDPAVAPGILTALGCGEGTFRTPGLGQPFAMYCPLSEDAPPAYFGLAFD